MAEILLWDFAEHWHDGPAPPPSWELPWDRISEGMSDRPSRWVIYSNVFDVHRRGGRPT